MLLLGIDIGTSSVKVAVVDAQTRECLATASYPEQESPIISKQAGWAEQSPVMWWEQVQQAILKAHASKKYNPADIAAIGIAYQMHGLVCLDRDHQLLRDSIIWCDSRAVEIGHKAFEVIGAEKCLSHLLNSPGNFTASKLAWVKQQEPAVYERIDKIILPGDYISMKLTGQLSCSISSLSEGVFWDFKNDCVSQDVFDYFQFDKAIIPEIRPVFAEHGRLLREVAAALSLNSNIPVTYKAGDQPNNALSLNVLQPGEVAATAGTSGVIYGVSDQLTYDKASRVNSFAHVNYDSPSSVTKPGSSKRLGVLLCINGAGILNRWIKNIAGPGLTYGQINDIANTVPAGSEGLVILPFGNGAERMLHNQIIHAHIHQIDLNKHGNAQLFRAAQEGIAFAFRYGLDILRENNLNPTLIRAGKANMFLSKVFTESFVNSLDVPVELYNNDGSVGAAIGAGLGAGIYQSAAEAFEQSKPLTRIEPVQQVQYEELYQRWLLQLNKQLQSI